MELKSTKQEVFPELKKLEFILNYLNPSESRIARLQSQILQRLEHSGEYQTTLGLCSNSEPIGLSNAEIDQSLNTIRSICETINVDITILSKQRLDQGSVCQILVRKKSQRDLVETRVALIGESKVGKSTLVGVLAKGVRENGKGSARNASSFHQTEKKQGSTTTYSQHLIYFDQQGKIKKPGKNKNKGDDLPAKSISLIDLPGSSKYKSAFLSGLISQIPDYALLMIDPSNFSENLNRDYINVIFALNLPLFVVLSKSEKCSSQHLDAALCFLSQEVARHSRLLLEVDNVDDVILSSRTFVNENVVPVFSLSFKTHKQTDLFVGFLNLLPPIHVWDSQSHSEFFIETWSASQDTCWLSGFLKKGSLAQGQEIFIGPDNNGNFSKTLINSIQIKSQNTDAVKAGHFCSILIDSIPDMREGMVLVDRKELAQTTFEFTCYLCPIDTFKVEKDTKGYKPMIYTQYSCQQACIISEPTTILPGETIKLKFRFLQRSEYLLIGTRIMINDESLTAMGTVSSTCY